MSATDDKKYMRHAIALAKAGEGWVHPNPLVGAVIVKDGRIIGEGYHRRYGELHAERNAIAALTESAEGATIYVTLEPCCHYGKTPPCTEAIIEQKLERVVIGSRDPNPLVAGKGAKILREVGIEVVEDFLRDECDALNPVFFHYISTKRPYVVMKYAMTADGKIATKTGASKWITGEVSRMEVQRLRHACMGICVGIGTVLADDPLLNCRCGAPGPEGVCHPIRIVCDSRLRIPPGSQICRTAREYETIVVCADRSLPSGEQPLEHPPGINLQEQPPGAVRPGEKEPMTVKVRRLQQMGITVLNAPCMGEGEQSSTLAADPASGEELTAPAADPAPGEEVSAPAADPAPRVDLARLMELLGQRGIDSVLLEGGGALNDSALRAGIVNEVRAFVAPKFFGGSAKSPVEGIGVSSPDQAVQMRLIETKTFGNDLMLRYTL